MAQLPGKPSLKTQFEPTAEWASTVESANETRRRFGRLYQSVEARAIADPVRAMAWGMAAGFVLGGGLFSRLTFRVARLAVKTALRAAGAGLVARTLPDIVALVEGLPAGQAERPA